MKPIFSSARTKFVAISATFLLAVSMPLSASAAPQVTVQSYYPDPVNGSTFYNVAFEEGNYYRNRIVEQQQDGTYVKWPDWISSISPDRNGQLGLYGYREGHNYDDYQYDSKGKTIIAGSYYNLSPDKKWAITERISYLSGKTNYDFVKNMETGEQTLFFTSNVSVPFEWINDHDLVMRTYSDTYKQNIISLYNPESSKTSLLTLGTLYGVNSEQLKLLFVKNEPERKLWIYDMTSHTSRLADSQSEVDQLFYSHPSSQPEQPKLTLPADFDITAVPEIAVPVEQRYESTLTINEKSIDLPYCFVDKGTTWLPVRAIADAMNWNLKVNKLAQEHNYLISLSTGSSTLELTANNSLLIEDTLFMTTKQLRSLGITAFTVTAKN